MRAFSLVELSIVLVILGLLTGGILSGQALIRAAELRSVASDLINYRTSVYTFQDQYSHLPGDMSDATRFWGSAGGNGSNGVCMDVESVATETCNGNGDGIVHTSVNYLDETYRFWQHLANAGLITGRYTGSHKNYLASDVLEKAVPKSKISNSGYAAFSESKNTIGWSDGGTQINNYLRFGGAITDTTYRSRIGRGMLLPKEIWGLDMKLDDGKPGAGQLVAHIYGGSVCVTTAVMTTSEYTVDNSNPVCILHYSY